MGRIAILTLGLILGLLLGLTGCAAPGVTREAAPLFHVPGKPVPAEQGDRISVYIWAAVCLAPDAPELADLERAVRSVSLDHTARPILAADEIADRLESLHRRGELALLSAPILTTPDRESAEVRLVHFEKIEDPRHPDGEFWRELGHIVGFTPRVTPDGTVYVDLKYRYIRFVGAQQGTPSTDYIDTPALLRSGETVVLGGKPTWIDAARVGQDPLFLVLHLRAQAKYRDLDPFPHQASAER